MESSNWLTCCYFVGNRSTNMTLDCEYPYVTNGSLCVPICGSWHPGGPVYNVVTRVVLCIASSLSLICSLLGITTWFIVGKKLLVVYKTILIQTHLYSLF